MRTKIKQKGQNPRAPFGLSEPGSHIVDLSRGSFPVPKQQRSACLAEFARVMLQVDRKMEKKGYELAGLGFAGDPNVFVKVCAMSEKTISAANPRQTWLCTQSLYLSMFALNYYCFAA